MLLLEIYKQVLNVILQFIVIGSLAITALSPMLLVIILDNWYYAILEIFTFPIALWFMLIVLSKLNAPNK